MSKKLTNIAVPVAGSSGAPTTGAHVVGEISVDSTGKGWVCTAAGTPGTWAALGGAGGASKNYATRDFARQAFR